MHLSGRKGNEKFVKNDIADCQKYGLKWNGVIQNEWLTTIVLRSERLFEFIYFWLFLLYG